MLSILAHAGHGHTDGNSLLHWLIEPAHLSLSIAAALVFAAGLGVVAWRKRRA
jgi:hypothetical protein